MTEIPLLELFTQLRKAGLPLGLTEYQLALKALQSGFGIRDRTALARMCRTLWVKSSEEQALFDYHFDKVMAADTAAFLAEEKAAADTAQILLSHDDGRGVRWRSQLRQYRYWLAAGGLLLSGVIAGLYWREVIQKQEALACPEFITAAEPSVLSQEAYLYSPKVRTCSGTAESDLTFEVIKKPAWLERQQSEDGNLTLSGIAPQIKDGIVNLQSLPNGDPVPLDTQTLSFPIAMSVDGAYIGTLTSTGKVRIWNSQGTKLTEVEAGEGVKDIRISPDGQHFLIQSTAEVPTGEVGSQEPVQNNGAFQRVVRLALWSTASKKTSQPIWSKTFLGYGLLADFNPTGQAIVVADNQQTLSVLDLAGELRHQQSYIGDPDNVNIRFGLDTEQMATIMVADSLQLIDQAGTLIHQTDRLPLNLRPCFSPSGQHFATRCSGTYDSGYRTGYNYYNYINQQQRDRIWHIDSQSNIVELSLPATIASIWQFSESWGHVLSIDNNEAFQLWYLQSETLMPIALPNPSAEYRFSPTGKYLWASPEQYNAERLSSRLANAKAKELSPPSPPQLWRLQNQQLIEIQLPANTERIQFLSEDQLLVTELTTGEQQLWRLNADTLTPIELPAELTDFGSPSLQIRMHERTTYVLSQKEDDTSKLFALTPENPLALATVLLPPNLLNVEFWESDGEYLSATLENGEIRLFRLEGTALIPILHSDQTGLGRAIELQVAGEYVYITRQEKSSGLFRLVNDQLVNIEMDTDSDLELSRNGKYAIANQSNVPRLWLLNGNKTTEIPLPKTVDSLEISANDQRLITYEGEDTSEPWNSDYERPKFFSFGRNNSAFPSRSAQTIQQSGVTRLWKIDNTKITELRTWQGYQDIRFDATGKYSVTMVDNDVVALLGVDSDMLETPEENPPQKEPTLIDLGFRGMQVLFDEAQRLVAISQTGQIKKWDFSGKLTQDTLLERPPESQLYVFNHLSPDVRAAIVDRKNVLLLNDQSQIVSKPDHDTAVIDIKSSADGQKLVTTTQQTSIYLWNTDAEGLKQLSLEGDISLASLSPDGKTVAAVEDGNLLRLLDANGEAINTIEHEQPIDLIAFYPGSDRFITTTKNTMNIWTVDGEKQRSIDLPSPIEQAVVSPNSEWLITAGERQISLWDSKGNLLDTQPSDIDSGLISFSPKGTLVVKSRYSSNRSLWNIVDQQLKRIDPVAEGNLAISDSGNYFLSWPDSNNSSNKEKLRATLFDEKGEKVQAFDTVPTDEFVHFSADDNHLALTEREYLINLQDIQTSKVIVLPHEEEPEETRLSPNSKYFISSMSDPKKLRVWTLADTASDNRVVAELDNEEPFRQFEFTADDASMVAITDNSGYLWNVEQNKYTHTFTHKGRITVLALSQDRKYFVTASSSDGFAQLRNATGELVAKLPHESGVLSAQFIANKNILITQSVNGVLRFWDVEGNQQAKPMKSFEMPITLNSFSMSADGSYLIETDFESQSSWYDGVVEYWDLSGDEPKNKKLSLAPESLPDKGAIFYDINDISFSPYSNHLSISTGYEPISNSSRSDFEIHVSIWDVKGGSPRMVKTLKNNRSLAWSPDGKSFLTVDSATAKTIRIWNFTGALPHEIEIEIESEQRIYSATFREDAQSLLVNLNGGESRVLDLQGNEIARTEKGKELLFSQSIADKKLVTLSGRDRVNVWDMTGTKVNSLTAENLVSDIASKKGSDSLAIALKNGSALLWNFVDDTSIPFTEQHNGSINDIRFSHDGRSLLTASGDTTVRLWNLKGQQKSPTLWNPGSVKAAFFSLDDRSIMALPDGASSGDNSIHQRSVSGGTVLKINPLTSDFNHFADIAEDSPTAVLEGQRTLHLWNNKGKQLNQLVLTDPSEDAMAISPDAEYVITLSGGQGRDGQRHLRSISDKKEIAAWVPTNQPNEVQFSPNSQYFVRVADEALETVTLKVTDKVGNSKVQNFHITVRPPEATAVRQAKKVNWIPVTVGSVLGLTCLLGGYAVTRWRLLAKRAATDDQQPADDTAEKATLPANKETSTTQVMPQFEDELQVAKAVQQSSKRLDHHYSDLAGIQDYTPVTRRQMKQSWRYLRKFVRSGPSVEFDVNATVRKISQDGMLLDPVFVPHRVNRTELLLLIDRDGSMVPFHMLAERLLETAVQGGRLRRTTPYYFHNSPDKYLYKKPDFQEAELLKTVLGKLHRDYGGVLIFSDAGAARGAMNPARLALTQQFIKQLNQQAKYTAWLNPIPRDRWAGSTAEDIAQLIPMFEFNRQGLHQSISVLQGKVLHKV